MDTYFGYDVSNVFSIVFCGFDSCANEFESIFVCKAFFGCIYNSLTLECRSRSIYKCMEKSMDLFQTVAFEFKLIENVVRLEF